MERSGSWSNVVFATKRQFRLLSVNLSQLLPSPRSTSLSLVRAREHPLSTHFLISIVYTIGI